MTGNVDPTSDEKLMGAAAHLFGPFAAIIVWAVQKDKSLFVKFQSLQALVFDASVMVAVGTVLFCVLGVGFLGMFGFLYAAVENPSSPEAIGSFLGFPFLFPFMMFTCILPFSLIILFLRLAATFSVLNGKSYHYPILGAWLKRFLEENQNDGPEKASD